MKDIQIIKNKEKIGELIFVTGVILELIVMMTDHVANWTLPFRGRVTHVAFALFLIKILFTKYDMRRAMILSLCGMIGILSYFTCGDEYVIRIVAFVAAAAGSDIKKVFEIVLWCTLAGTLMIMVLSIPGITGMVVDVRDYGRGVVEARYCLGFNHANNVGAVCWFMLSLAVLVYGEKFKTVHFLCFLIADLIIYRFTVSRTGLMAAAFVIIMTSASYYSDRYSAKYKAGSDKPAGLMMSRILFTVFVLALTACVGLTLIVAADFPYKHDILIFLDKLFTGRLEMVWEHAPLTTWRFFPDMTVLEYVDNGFASTVYTYGIVVFIMMLVSMVWASIRMYQRRDTYALAVSITAVMVAFMENSFVFNISLLCNVIVTGIIWVMRSLRETEPGTAS